MLKDKIKESLILLDELENGYQLGFELAGGLWNRDYKQMRATLQDLIDIQSVEKLFELFVAIEKLIRNTLAPASMRAFIVYAMNDSLQAMAKNYELRKSIFERRSELSRMNFCRNKISLQHIEIYVFDNSIAPLIKKREAGVKMSVYEIDELAEFYFEQHKERFDEAHLILNHGDSHFHSYFLPPEINKELRMLIEERDAKEHGK